MREGPGMAHVWCAGGGQNPSKSTEVSPRICGVRFCNDFGGRAVRAKKRPFSDGVDRLAGRCQCCRQHPVLFRWFRRNLYSQERSRKSSCERNNFLLHESKLSESFSRNAANLQPFKFQQIQPELLRLSNYGSAFPHEVGTYYDLNSATGEMIMGQSILAMLFGKNTICSLPRGLAALCGRCSQAPKSHAKQKPMETF